MKRFTLFTFLYLALGVCLTAIALRYPNLPSSLQTSLFRRDAEGEKTAKLIRETGAECLYVHSEVSSEADIKALVEKTIATYGKLDCAFNNAAIMSPFKPLHEQ